jgi:hypothetical protein
MPSDAARRFPLAAPSLIRGLSSYGVPSEAARQYMLAATPLLLPLPRLVLSPSDLVVVVVVVVVASIRGSEASCWNTSQSHDAISASPATSFAGRFSEGFSSTKEPCCAELPAPASPWCRSSSSSWLQKLGHEHTPP